MKTIKIIDLLNKIANGEEVPKKIKYKNKIFEHWDNGNIQDYWHKGNKQLFDDFIDCSRYTDLNDEVKILDEETYSYTFKKDEKGCFTDKDGNRFSIIPVDEEDEFEDIEEWKISDYYKCDDYQLIRDNFEIVNKQINQLIKNQKKIIERLKDEK